MGWPRRRCIPGALWHCCCSCTWQLTQQGLREREDSSYFLDSKIVKKRKQQEFTRFLYSFVVKVSWNRESTPFPKAAKGYKRRLMMERNSVSSRRQGTFLFHDEDPQLHITRIWRQCFYQWLSSPNGSWVCREPLLATSAYNSQAFHKPRSEYLIVFFLVFLFTVYEPFYQGVLGWQNPLSSSKLSGSYNTQCLSFTCYFQATAQFFSVGPEELHGPWE